MDEKKQLLCMRIMLVFFVLISVVIALDPPTFIAQLMGISWGALAGLIVVPVVSWLTPKMKMEDPEGAFACLEETVVVRKKRSIEE